MSNRHAEMLNELLRVELSAAQTYRRAMAQVDEGPAATMLRGIYEHHHAAAETLCMEIRQMGSEPEHDCDGAFAPTLDEACTVCGNPSAIQALKDGEATGLQSYEGALLDRLLPVTSRTLIRTKLLPQTRKHLEVLDQLMTAG
jgi:hypothetical protein